MPRAGGRVCRPSRVQRLERAAMKNGFKPGVRERLGVYVGQWADDAKQGEEVDAFIKRAILRCDGR